mmetsp:Transcript_9059/g.22161  ORF Transcript_9059/g.22161 Transcript_9059/m.22161 type:complete len:93 (-) Transcript_9059:416-694(-)
MTIKVVAIRKWFSLCLNLPVSCHDGVSIACAQERKRVRRTVSPFIISAYFCFSAGESADRIFKAPVEFLQPFPHPCIEIMPLPSLLSTVLVA